MSVPTVFKDMRMAFEVNEVVCESTFLTLKDVDGYDVYNCSVPFKYKGKMHIYGRVEKRIEWANSHVRLFVETGKDGFTMVPEFNLQLEDPYVQRMGNEMIFGGTHVIKDGSRVLSYYGYFYRGTAEDMRYFTTGPDFMKDIRILALADDRVGIFSRVRTPAEVYVGFATVDSIEHLTTAAIAATTPIDFIKPGMWGGVNQPYLLSSGKVGCIAHNAYNDVTTAGEPVSVYVNYSFVFDPATRLLEEEKVIGTKSCYPQCPAKKSNLVDCAFTSGIVMREDGKCDLYSGLGDTCEGRIAIDYPFEGHGTIVNAVNF